MLFEHTYAMNFYWLKYWIKDTIIEKIIYEIKMYENEIRFEVCDKINRMSELKLKS